jgi:RHS repeat-associated protein
MRRCFSLVAALSFFTQLSAQTLNPYDEPLPVDALGASSVEPYEDFAKHLKSRQQIAVLGPDLMGDRINFYNGGLSFMHSDASVPGNGSLPVSVSRSFDVSARPIYAQNDKPFADWDLDTPRLEGTYGRTTTGLTWEGTRCSTQQAPAGVLVPGGAFYQATDFWAGVQAKMPSGGELLVADSTTPQPSTAPAGGFKWVTPGYTYFSCLPGAANDGGDGFLAVTPDGTHYRFTHKSEYYETPMSKPQSGMTTLTGTLLRRRVVLYATLVTTRFGHTVTYNYSGNARAPAQLNSITGSDGRTLTIAHNANGHISTITEGTRAWTYRYAGTGTRRSLTEVERPDTSKWLINLALLSDVNIAYSVDGPPRCNSIPVVKGLFAGSSPNLVSDVTGTITHPSGATGTFVVTHRLHSRSNVPRNCLTIRDSNGAVVEEYSLYVRAAPMLAIQSKAISGPGLPPMLWDFEFGSSLSFDLSGNGCFASTCAGSASAKVWGPNFQSGPSASSREYLELTFGNSFAYNEDKQTGMQRGSAVSVGATPVILESDVQGYQLPTASPPTTARIGRSLRVRGDGFAAEHPRPNSSMKISRDGATFNRTASGFDAYYRPTQVIKSSSLGFSKTETMTYYDDLALWVIGQMQQVSVSDGSATYIPERTTYHGTTALPNERFAFEKLQTRFSYHTDAVQAGLVHEIFDGGNTQRTRLSDYFRGVPREVRYQDENTESVTVNGFGEISSHTNTVGGVTNYTYDAMGRMTGITYPTEVSNPQWHPTTMSFLPSSTAALGLPAGHWQRTVKTGSEAAGFSESITYYDALYRPLVEDQRERLNTTITASSRRMSNRAFDGAGRQIYQSYPRRSITQFDTRFDGTQSYFDGIARPTSSHVDAEANQNLITEYSYLTNFITEVTDPRNNRTRMSFQAFDQPTNDAPVLIQMDADAPIPNGINTSTSRDVFGKPLTIARTDNTLTTTLTRRFIYDPEQRLCKRIEPESGAMVMDYNATNTVNWMAPGTSLTGISSCDRASVAPADKTTYGYDNRNRVTSESYGDSTLGKSMTYTPDGLLSTLTHDGTTWTYGYYKRRLLQSETLSLNSQSYAIEHRLDAYGNLASQRYPDAAVMSYLPNRLGEASQVSDGAGSHASSISYHPSGPTAGFTTSDARTYTRTLNRRLLPERVSTSGVYDDQFAFDANGNISSITDQRSPIPSGNNRNHSMGYDAANRLTSVQSTQLGNFSYSYNDFDDLSTQSRPGQNLTYQYDANFRLTKIHPTGQPSSETIGYSWDTLGNATQRRAQAIGQSNQTLIHDRANRLREVRENNQTVAKYRYDGHGHRVSVCTPGNERLSIYTQEGGLLWEQSAPSTCLGTVGSDDIFRNGFENAARTSANTTTTTRYAYLQSKLIGKVENNSIIAQHTDFLGSVLADGIGSNLTINPIREAYGAPGNGQYRPGPGFTGHITDTTTRLSYMQQRYYDPYAGRFLQVDPVRADTTNFGRYNYAANNPYAYTDPDGRCPEKTSQSICISSKKIEPTNSQNIQLSDEQAKAVLAGKSEVQLDSNATKEKLGSLNSTDEGLEVKAWDNVTTGTTSTANTAAGSLPENAEAVVHGHLKESKLMDDKKTMGDAEVLQRAGLPNVAVGTDGRVVVHELVEGKYQVRMLSGKFTADERKHFRSVVNSRQTNFNKEE